MKQLKKKLPIKAYMLFVIYDGSFSRYNRNRTSWTSFITSLKHHKS